MEGNKSFKQKLNDLSNKFNLSDYNQFNLFRVMYKMTEEKNLHSRFIAFLLNPIGSHEKGDLFLRLFLQEFQMSDFDLDEVKVLPDEHEKREEDNIDILITNAKKQAIIIENKIFAGDSNKDEILENERGLCTHKYQIPRYYNKMICKEFEVMQILYLTPGAKKPSFYIEFPKVVKDVLMCKDYITHIMHWLEICIDQCKEDDNLKRSIIQYRQATIEFMNDHKLAISLQALSADELDDSYSFWEKEDIEEIDKVNLILEQYMHVKWHTIHSFYLKLKTAIEAEFKVEVEGLDNEKITAVCHRKSNTRTNLFFNYHSKVYYICNDKNGFSIGIEKEEKGKDDFILLFRDKDYSFFRFNNKEVFSLIKPENQFELVKIIIDELVMFDNKHKIDIQKLSSY